MNKFVNLIAIYLVILAPVLSAAEVKVEYVNVDKYSDIRPGDANRAKFKKRLFNELNEQFSKSARKIAQDAVLHIKVTNIDLAGEIDPFFSKGMGPIRVVKRMHVPKISLNYRLESKAGTVIQEDEVTLKDLSFLDKGRILKYEHGGFSYEKRLINDWIVSAFIK